MAVGGHVVLNKLNNCLENFQVFCETRRFFDAGSRRHRNRRFFDVGSGRHWNWRFFWRGFGKTPEPEVLRFWVFKFLKSLVMFSAISFFFLGMKTSRCTSRCGGRSHLQSFPMVSCMLLSNGSQALQTSRFLEAKVLMDTCEM